MPHWSRISKRGELTLGELASGRGRCPPVDDPHRRQPRTGRPGAAAPRPPRPAGGPGRPLPQGAELLREARTRRELYLRERLEAMSPRRRGRPGPGGRAHDPAGRRRAMKSPVMFRSLRRRNFRLFLGGQLVSNLGTWMQNVALAWLVLQITHSPLDVGVVSAVQFVPSMAFGAYGGVVADRFAKRSLLVLHPERAGPGRGGAGHARPDGRPPAVGDLRRHVRIGDVRVDRHAHPPGFRVRDGRPGRPAQRRGAEQRHVQPDPYRRPGVSAPW